MIDNCEPPFPSEMPSCHACLGQVLPAPIPCEKALELDRDDQQNTHNLPGLSGFPRGSIINQFPPFLMPPGGSRRSGHSLGLGPSEVTMYAAWNGPVKFWLGSPGGNAGFCSPAPMSSLPLIRV